MTCSDFHLGREAADPHVIRRASIAKHGVSTRERLADDIDVAVRPLHDRDALARLRGEVGRLPDAASDASVNLDVRRGLGPDVSQSYHNPSLYLAGRFPSGLTRPHSIVHAGRRSP